MRATELRQRVMRWITPDAELAEQGEGGLTEMVRWVELTTDPDNIASQKVIERNGGVFVKRFFKEAAYGPAVEALLWRIDL